MDENAQIQMPDGGPPVNLRTTNIRGPWFGTRHVLALMGFLGFVNVYAMRVNLSVAIVVMVNQTYINNNSSSNGSASGTCPAPVTPINSTTPHDADGPFDWDEKTQSLVLGSFFYGYVLTQLPGGRLAEMFGGKWIYGCGILITSVFTLLMPLAAKLDFRLLIAVRVIEGLGEGVTFPVMHAMIAEWAPPLERSKMSTFIYAGSMMGTVISLPMTGLICDYVGWEAAFYIFGSFGIVWFAFWTFLAYDTPAKHPRITQEERDLIEISQGKRPLVPVISRASSVVSDLDGSSLHCDDDEPIIAIAPTKRHRKIPWKSIFTSVPFWAILIAHSCQNWGFYTLLTEMPSYMKEILHFNIQENAFLSALPYLCMWLIAISGSHLADYVRSRGWLSTTSTRKAFNSVAFCTPAICLILLYFAKCNKPFVVALLCTTVGINGFQFSSVNVNHIDIASNFAGTLMGITNMVANTMGFLAPMAISYIIEGHEDIDHWQTVFYIAAGVYGVGNLLYCLMASGEEQPWNRCTEDDTVDGLQQPSGTGSITVGPIMPTNPEDLIGDIY